MVKGKKQLLRRYTTRKHYTGRNPIVLKNSSFSTRTTAAADDPHWSALLRDPETHIAGVLFQQRTPPQGCHGLETVLSPCVLSPRPSPLRLCKDLRV